MCIFMRNAERLEAQAPTSRDAWEKLAQASLVVLMAPEGRERRQAWVRLTQKFWVRRLVRIAPLSVGAIHLRVTLARARRGRARLDVRGATVEQLRAAALAMMMPIPAL